MPLVTGCLDWLGLEAGLRPEAHLWTKPGDGDNRGGGIRAKWPGADCHSRNSLWALVLVLIPEQTGRVTLASPLPSLSVHFLICMRAAVVTLWSLSVAALGMDSTMYRASRLALPPRHMPPCSRTPVAGVSAFKGCSFCGLIEHSLPISGLESNSSSQAAPARA